MNSQTHAPSAAHPGYRADIDGLRAIAVLFVISGYLITGILLRNLRALT